MSCLATLVLLVSLTQSGLAGTRETSPDDLGMWPQMQRPEPLPETRPDPVPMPEIPLQEGQDQQPGHPVSADDHQEPSLLAITGTIMKEHGQFVLKAWDQKTYQIDDQDKVKKFEGQLVNIVGRLDVSTNTIHLQTIELKS